MFEPEQRNKGKEGGKPASKPNPSEKQPGNNKDKEPKMSELRFRIPPPIEADYQPEGLMNASRTWRS